MTWSNPDDLESTVYGLLAQFSVQVRSVHRLPSSTQSQCTVLESTTGARYVVKAFNAKHVANTRAAVEHEFGALQRFHAAVGESGSLRAPRPLAISADSRAYLMEEVPGMSLGRHLARKVRRDEYSEIASLIREGLKLYYREQGEPYGDFHPGNILISSADGHVCVSFLDPTMADRVYEEAARFSPMDMLPVDIGYWMFSVAAQAARGLVTSPLATFALLRFTRLLVKDSANDAVSRQIFVRAAFDVARWNVGNMVKGGGAKERVLAKVASGLLRTAIAPLRSREASAA